MSGLRIDSREPLREDDPVLRREQIRLRRAAGRDYAEATGPFPEGVDRVLAAIGAAELRRGGLVAFPTETVYGLGADARNLDAVRRLYETKGRPGNHPVIVHTADLKGAAACSRGFSPLAGRLAERFWPGPLTLILPKASWVPDAVTGGQDSVGVRVPAHPLALLLLHAFGGPVAAPSANRFGRVSPTTADHVEADLGKDVDRILDGGPCKVGLESTIVDVRSDAPVILRPGGVTREDLEKELGRPVAVKGEGELRVSGALDSHYAPRARVEAVEASRIPARAAELGAEGLRVRVLEPEEVEARDLYASLRAADAEGADVILAPLPEEEGLGRAVADRLRKASGPRT